MIDKHELAELAPRDIVARSIFLEMQQHATPYVYLSLKHLDSEKIKKRFPNIFQKCTELGIDMTDRIPVAPAAHYMVGGIKTDTFGRTNIPHLYVCGELASSGIMGANRLASNSLIECLVFGRRAVEDSVQNRRTLPIPETTCCFHLDNTRRNNYLQLKNTIAELMTQHAGIIRSASGLTNALHELHRLQTHLPMEDNEYYSQANRNLLTVAELIIRSALFREESRGGHFRSDYPHTSESFVCHIIQQKGKTIHTIPVNTSES